MSRGARIVVAIVTIVGAFSFALIGAFLGPALPAGSWPFYGLSAFCAVIAIACLVRNGRAITLRIIGSVIFAAYVVYAIVSIGNANFDRALRGLLVWGLPSGYLAIVGQYPWWGHVSEAFRSKDSDDAGR